MKIPHIKCKHLKGRTKFDALWDLQDGMCFYCGVKMKKHIHGNPFEKTTATIDHIKPVSKGGKKSAGNIVLACRKCNSEKGSMDFFEYIKNRSE
jgi:5-methylcytosine-specific restriction endonuclease McrA